MSFFHFNHNLSAFFGKKQGFISAIKDMQEHNHGLAQKINNYCLYFKNYCIKSNY